ncbi:MAG: hypothetical protein EU531_05145 [Promethearchaeota archaeon]|nr:MAG: hypothetical protein EU531_05145 [Candidatus Lokiarchaeota archaeon]
MLKVFIFYEEKNKWIEEHSHLLYHDFAAFIDEDTKLIYLWNGPKSTKERLKKGTEVLYRLIQQFAETDFQIKKLNKKIPSHIKSCLENYLEVAKKEEKIADYQYSQFFTIRIHALISIISLILPIIVFVILASSLFWDTLGNDYIISANNYNNWLLMAFILLVICLLLFIPQLIIAIYEYDKAIIVFSSISMIISISLLVYLQQGIFLFQFQESSTPTLYYITKIDIYLFLLLISSAIMLFEIPNFIKTVNFLATYKKFLF